MKYLYFDGSAGMSGDMILGALLDLSIPVSTFKEKMSSLKVPVEIQAKETTRAGLRGLKVDVKVKKESKVRRWADIEILIQKSQFSSAVKKNALAVFKALFQAEAKVHGYPFEETHLHEAAADDAVIDVVGSCFLAEALDVGRIFASPLNVGSGWVKSAHGVLPVPPPAVAELLKNIPIYSAWVKAELVTPTGAAIISTWAEKFTSFPEISYEKVGCGAGSKNFHDFPNLLRVFYGEEKNLQAKRVYQVEAHIDDSNPQILANFIDRALELGALDAALTPIVMKKNRLAAKLTLLTDIDKMDVLIRAIFQETSSIGVRYFPVERRILDREVRKVKVQGEAVGIKISYLDGYPVNVQPEFADCLKVAEKNKLPAKEIAQKALAEYWKNAGRGAAQKPRRKDGP